MIDEEEEKKKRVRSRSTNVTKEAPSTTTQTFVAKPPVRVVGFQVGTVSSLPQNCISISYSILLCSHLLLQSLFQSLCLAPMQRKGLLLHRLPQLLLHFLVALKA